MTVVFVHGVPETPALWDSVRRLIPQESVALRLPGFGSARPPHLTDKDGYADWLAGELLAIGEPVDLVGHDWGGHLAMRVVSAYADVPVRSWVSDVVYGWHPDYQWHEVAALWNKSPEGEEFLSAIRAAVPGSGGTFGDVLRTRGMTADFAAEVDAAHDETMGAAILALYRSAWPNFHIDWGTAVTGPIDTPGLVLMPTGDDLEGVTQDAELVVAQNVELARRFGAQLARLDGLGHYWMLQEPERAAETLQKFWAELPR
ncbi:alpha/beta fold hydrolase [Streptomyces canus]|uniref:alpha/beta fold hydrolase n=1 Tax=Streptomyces canus TaxID=58343 RepID=UPI00035D8492|nr:alpha/beta hydrolase [Streptomyces canus]